MPQWVKPDALPADRMTVNAGTARAVWRSRTTRPANTPFWPYGVTAQGPFPCSLAVRSLKETPGYLPGGTRQRLLRSHSPPCPGVVSRTPGGPHPSQPSGRLTAPASYPQGLRRLYIKTGDDTGTSRIPLQHARRAHDIQRS